MSDAPLLSVEGLRTHIHTDRGTVRAVDGVDFTVERGEAVCLVGESGSGKSVTCETLTDLVPTPPAEVVGGTVQFDGERLRPGPTDFAAVRGGGIGHVFQNPQGALDPVYTVGDQLVEAIEAAGGIDARPRDRAVSLLKAVGIPDPAARIDDYPHELSGGMCQRVALAIALAGDPALLVADEPTTAVDVTVQARLLEILRARLDAGMALLLVTHDLRVVAELADRVLVMYGGTIVERGPVEAVFDRPAHPYTQALFDSYDGVVDRPERAARSDLPTDGCRFRGECPYAVEGCAERPVDHTLDTDGHAAACVHYADDAPADLLAAARDASPAAGGSDD